MALMSAQASWSDPVDSDIQYFSWYVSYTKVMNASFEGFLIHILANYCVIDTILMNNYQDCFAYKLQSAAADVYHHNKSCHVRTKSLVFGGDLLLNKSGILLKRKLLKLLTSHIVRSTSWQRIFILCIHFVLFRSDHWRTHFLLCVTRGCPPVYARIFKSVRSN